MKIFCNKCFQEVDVRKYDLGIYVEPCKCVIDEHQRSVIERQEQGFEDGWDEGYTMGKRDLQEELIDGDESLIEYERRIKCELKNKIIHEIHKI